MSWFELYLDEIPVVYPYQQGINEKYQLPGLGENPLFVFYLCNINKKIFALLTSASSSFSRLWFAKLINLDRWSIDPQYTCCYLPMLEQSSIGMGARLQQCLSRRVYKIKSEYRSKLYSEDYFSHFDGSFKKDYQILKVVPPVPRTQKANILIGVTGEADIPFDCSWVLCVLYQPWGCKTIEIRQNGAALRGITPTARAIPKRLLEWRSNRRWVNNN